MTAVIGELYGTKRTQNQWKGTERSFPKKLRSEQPVGVNNRQMEIISDRRVSMCKSPVVCMN